MGSASVGNTQTRRGFGGVVVIAAEVLVECGPTKFDRGVSLG